jgi:hypothetical protein
MKKLALRCSMLLALALPLVGAACDQAPEEATQTPVDPATVESHQQAIIIDGADCSEYNRTIAIPAGPGHPINICKIDYFCVTVDSTGYHFSFKSLFRAC